MVRIRKGPPDGDHNRRALRVAASGSAGPEAASSA